MRDRTWRRCGASGRRAACCPSRTGTPTTSRDEACSAAGRRGSAMPLAWAHAEYVKLVRSIALGHAIDRPEAAWQRYHGQAPAAVRDTWRFTAPRPAMRAGRTLRFELMAPCRVHCSLDGWRTTVDIDARDTRLGVWVADVPGSERLATWRRGGRHVLLARCGPLGGPERPYRGRRGAVGVDAEMVPQGAKSGSRIRSVDEGDRGPPESPQLHARPGRARAVPRQRARWARRARGGSSRWRRRDGPGHSRGPVRRTPARRRLPDRRAREPGARARRGAERRRPDPAGHARRDDRAPAREEHLRRHRHAGHDHRRRLLRARDQPAPWVHVGAVRRRRRLHGPAAGHARRDGLPPRADHGRREGDPPGDGDPAAAPRVESTSSVRARRGVDRTDRDAPASAARRRGDRLLPAAGPLPEQHAWPRSSAPSTCRRPPRRSTRPQSSTARSTS